MCILGIVDHRQGLGLPCRLLNAAEKAQLQQQMKSSGSPGRTPGNVGFGKISREAASADAAAVPPFPRMRYGGEAHRGCFAQMAFSSMRRFQLLQSLVRS